MCMSLTSPPNRRSSFLNSLHIRCPTKFTFSEPKLVLIILSSRTEFAIFVNGIATPLPAPVTPISPFYNEVLDDDLPF